MSFAYHPLSLPVAPCRRYHAGDRGHLSRDGVDTSVAGLLEKAAQSRRFTGSLKLLGKSEHDCF